MERGRKRIDYIAVAEYVLIAEDISRANKRYVGIIINVSKSGIGIYLYEHLNIGQEIEIKHNELPVSYRKAVIRWIKAVKNNFYRAGLMFTDPIKWIEDK